MKKILFVISVFMMVIFFAGVAGAQEQKSETIKIAAPLTALDGLPKALQYASFVKQRPEAKLVYIFISRFYLAGSSDGNVFPLTTEWHYVFRDRQGEFSVKCYALKARQPIAVPGNVPIPPDPESIPIDPSTLRLDSDQATLLLGSDMARVTFIDLDIREVDGKPRPLWQFIASNVYQSTILAVTADTGKPARMLDGNRKRWTTQPVK